MAATLEKVTAEMAGSLISEYNGKKTIQKICAIIDPHIAHVRTYLLK
jgi:hypothetical protein